MRLRILLLTLACALLAPGLAHAAGGNYVFAGGTAAEQTQVRAALDASSFNWSVVPQTITIHVLPGHESEATVGNIWLDSDLVDSGKFAWGTIQHEYAHQVDFFLLDDTLRTQLQGPLGGSSWWATSPTQEHSAAACERFASTLAWTYWPSKANSMRPTAANDESAAVAPAAFRSLLSQALSTVTLTNAPRVVRG